MTHPLCRNPGARLLMAMGCVMVFVVPLVVIASCAFRGSPDAPLRPVYNPPTPAAVVYVPAPQRGSQASRRYIPAPAPTRAAPRRAPAPAAPAARPPARR